MAAGSEAVAEQLAAVASRRYGRSGAEQLVELARKSVARGVASRARGKALAILGDQLAHTQANIAAVEQEITALVRQGEAATSLSSVPEFGAQTVAVRRSEVGDVRRFVRGDQLVAYAGLASRVRERGKMKGPRKVAKQGSGLLRRALYMAAWQSLRMKQSALGDYYRHLVGQGVTKMSALLAVMRKMLLVMYGLLKHGMCTTRARGGPTLCGSPRRGGRHGLPLDKFHSFCWQTPAERHSELSNWSDSQQPDAKRATMPL